MQDKTNIQDAELKPCPFCGRDDRVGLTEAKHSTWLVVCLSCGARGPRRLSMATAVEAWDYRSAVAQLNAVVDGTGETYRFGQSAIQ